jgi:predicted Zn-dependent protease
MIASEQFAQYAEYAMQGMQLLFLSFSRDNEREADRLGVEYSSKIGYDAHKMADFFQVLQKMNMEATQGGVPTFLSTHPDPGDRYNSVNQQATEWQQKMNSTIFKVNADNYLQMIDGIVYGEDPRQGFADGGIFYHPELRFKFTMPAGWAMENLPTQVNMAPSDGKAIVVFTLSAQKTLNEAAQNAIDQLGLTVLESKQTSVGNMPALAMASKIVSKDQPADQQQTVKLLSYFINYNNQIYLFHGVSTEADFTGYIQAFESTMKSFSVLTDPARLSVRPQRIHVKKVQRTGTLADALTYYGMKKEKMNELALLNNLELTDQVQAGKLIKIIGE